MHRNKSVSTHKFSMVPKSDVPRSTFRRETAHKTTLDAGFLVPIYVDEVLPGDTFKLRMTAFVRMATPIFPIMDNLHMETFYFFVPYRIVWRNFVRQMGEQDNPGDSVDYVTPQCISPAGGYPICSVQDYMGLPTVGQIPAGNTFSHSALPLRAYNLIYNEWFRDQNLIDKVEVPLGDENDDPNFYALKRRGKRHDYFTSCLPWPQKGVDVGFGLDSVQAPLVFPAGVGSRLAVQSDQVELENWPSVVPLASGGVSGTAESKTFLTASESTIGGQPQSGLATLFGWADTANLSHVGAYADLTLAAQLTVNQIRMSFQIQKLLEKDARGGTRYVESNVVHFGVRSPDARLQRPEYLGGGKAHVQISPIAQTSATDIQGSTSPQGNLAAYGTVLGRRQGFTHSFVEHGVVIGLVCIYADLTYQQGLNRMWSRRTRFDHYFPVLSHLGEQAVYNREIYCQGTPQDDEVFGYQERWAEYRYKPPMITGMFRSTVEGTLDSWHLAQRFNNLPVLNEEFIEEVPPIERVVAAGSLANNQQFIFDSFFEIRSARPMPLYSVPGLIDHF